MKRAIFLTLLISLITIISYSQTFKNIRPCYTPKKEDAKIIKVLDDWFKPFDDKKESDREEVIEFFENKMTGEYTSVNLRAGDFVSATVDKVIFSPEGTHDFIYGFADYYTNRPIFVCYEGDRLEIELKTEDNEEGMYFEFDFVNKTLITQTFKP